MLKLEKVLEQKNATPFSLTDTTGDLQRFKSIQRVINGEMEITGLSQDVVQGLARGLGVQIEDIMEDFDFDGTTGQISTLKRMIERFRKRLSRLTEEEINESHMIIQINDDQLRYNDSNLTERLNNLDFEFERKVNLNRFYEKNGFVWATNIDKLENGGGFVINPYPLDKKDFDFINPKLAHSEQDLPKSVELNALYLDETKESGRWSKKNQPISINTVANKRNGSCSTVVIYTPLPLGGDFKIALSVFDDQGEVELSEVYGVEWQDQDDNKNIVYYKGQFFEPITKNTINRCKKRIISEVEFYKSVHTQFSKLKVVR